MQGRLWIAVMPLAVAETLIWAAFYYSFPAFLPAWEADAGWSRTGISLAFTGALIVTGLLAPQAGRLIDRGFGQAAFLGAIVIGALLLIAFSMAQDLWQFRLIWLALGAVNAFCLYNAVFAIVTTTMGAKARPIIIWITLVAGFAGTIAFPAAWALTQAMGWRAAMLVFAGTILGVALPLALVGLRLLAPYAEDAATKPKATGREGRAVLRNPVFWLIAFGFAAISLTHGMIITHIRPIMESRGVAEALGVAVASMIGPMQVLGRVIMVSMQSRAGIHAVATACFLGMMAGAVVLLLATGSPLLAAVFVVPYGAAYGVISIVRPILTAEFLGRAGFGTISGMLAVPYLIGSAAAPSIAALIWRAAGYDAVITLGIVLLAAGLVSLQLARRRAIAG